VRSSSSQHYRMLPPSPLCFRARGCTGGLGVARGSGRSENEGSERSWGARMHYKQRVDGVGRFGHVGSIGGLWLGKSDGGRIREGLVGCPGRL
jgi:hypothetical protein